MARKWEPLCSPISVMPAMFGVIDGRDYPSFTLKAGDNFGRCQMRMQHFERNIAFKIGIVGVIDRTLAARRQACDDTVLSDHLCGCVRHNSPNPESTEGGGWVSVLKRQEGAPLNLG